MAASRSRERATQFWFEFSSSDSDPAAMCIEHPAEQADVALVWKAFLLGAIFWRNDRRDDALPFAIAP